MNVKKSCGKFAKVIQREIIEVERRKVRKIKKNNNILQIFCLYNLGL
jgi:hypothetical protein